MTRRTKATPARPFLVRGGDEWGFCSAGQLRVGDLLRNSALADALGEERIDAIERMGAACGRPRSTSPSRKPNFADEVWFSSSGSLSLSIGRRSIGSGSKRLE